MPRYRKLHTKTLESLDINDMPDDFTRLFWVLLPLVVCREGRGLNSATWLKSKLFPLREDVTTEQVQGALDWCIGRSMMVPYSVDGRDYFYIPSFHRYQGNTLKEAESDYPPPQSQVGSSSGVSPELVKSKSATDTDAVFNMQYSDTNAPPLADAGAGDAAEVLKEFGMRQVPTVLKETALTPTQIIETTQYAEQEGLNAGILRTMLRNNEAHRPRAPTDSRTRYGKSEFAQVQT